MASPSPDRPARVTIPTHPGFQLLMEVTAALSAGVFSESAMSAVVEILRRGLGARLCRLWVRDVEGKAFECIAPQGQEPTAEDTARISAEIRGAVSGMVDSWDAIDMHVLMAHEGDRLGLIEVRVPRDGREVMARDVLSVVANVLSPLIASRELSMDLAYEVARRAREIEEQRRFTGKVIDSLPTGVYVIDRQYRIQAWNRKRETGTLGVPREDAIGRIIFDVLHRQSRELLQREFDEVFQSGRVQVYESLSQGDNRHYRITKIPMRLNDDEITHLITIGEDISEWKQVQGQIAESEKLAAIGQLAAGVMHEINNPLATIGACVDAVTGRLKDAPSADPGIAEYLGIMDSEVERCKRIVNQLLDLSRPRAGTKTPQDLNHIVEETLRLLKHHDRFKHLVVRREMTADLPPVLASGDHLTQVFMALMLNAADAMNARGTLTVTTGRNPQRADEVFIAFSDTGAGIPKQDIQKIFEPFYTTKPQGRGTGLGLSICYGIVADHRGRIEVDSTLGHGSTFTVILPIDRP